MADDEGLVADDTEPDDAVAEATELMVDDAELVADDTEPDDAVAEAAELMADDAELVAGDAEPDDAVAEAAELEVEVAELAVECDAEVTVEVLFGMTDSDVFEDAENDLLTEW